MIQGGEDPKDALSLEVILRKRALQLVALLRKMTCNLRHPKGLRYTVQYIASCLIYICIYIYMN